MTYADVMPIVEGGIDTLTQTLVGVLPVILPVIIVLGVFFGIWRYLKGAGRGGR